MLKTAAFAHFGYDLTAPQGTTIVELENGDFVFTLYEEDFSDDMRSYRHTYGNWKKQRSVSRFRNMLTRAVEERRRIRVVLNTALQADLKKYGPEKAPKEYIPRLDLIGRVVAHDPVEGTFEMAFNPVSADVDDSVSEHAQPIRSTIDARVSAIRSVHVRYGQADFRTALIEAYEGRCAITGCQAKQVLDAAHIKPHMGEYTNRVDNGLLLRTDLHALFDLGLIWIDEDYTVAVSPDLDGTEYDQLNGQKMRMPKQKAHWPHPEHLKDHARFADSAPR